jgi:hypothetical protein
MKKEVFLAIAIGFALGLVITFGIWTANKSLAGIKTTQLPTEETQLVETTPSATTASANNPAPVATGELVITAPEDETLTNQNTITVTGKTFVNATVVITFEDDQLVVLADSSGLFSASVDLIAGYNVINVTAFDANGSEANQMLTVTYSTAKI